MWADWGERGGGLCARGFADGPERTGKSGNEEGRGKGEDSCQGLVKVWVLGVGEGDVVGELAAVGQIWRSVQIFWSICTVERATQKHV